MLAKRWAILLDLDGTLIDTVDLILQSMRFAFSTHPRRVPTDAEWVAGIGTPLVTQLAAYAESDGEIAALLQRYRQYQIDRHDALTHAFPGVRETLELMHGRGHPVAVVTSKADAMAHRGLVHVGLAPYVDVVVGCDSTTHHKPHPEPVLLALAKLGADARAALFVGDSPHDVGAGNAAGVATAAALWGPFTRAELAVARPTMFLTRFSDLPVLLASLEEDG
ncbi:MAG: HAD family hydrolase [Gemmatimonadaceae bacterium]